MKYIPAHRIDNVVAILEDIPLIRHEFTREAVLDIAHRILSHPDLIDITLADDLVIGQVGS